MASKNTVSKKRSVEVSAGKDGTFYQRKRRGDITEDPVRIYDHQKCGQAMVLSKYNANSDGYIWRYVLNEC